jgi:hypothetical protein
MWGVAAKLVKLGQGVDAIPMIDECLDRAAEKNGGPQFSGLADSRIEYFEKKKDAVGCRTTAERWERFEFNDAGSLYHAARYRAITAKVIGAAGNAEADRAMAWLTKAVAAGYKNIADAKKNANFDALQDRADFRKLVGN